MTIKCQHIKTSGENCGCPALRGQTYCYFHSRVPEGESTVRATPQELSSLQLAVSDLEDRAAIQHAISEVTVALANGHISARHASTMLYGLQIASQTQNAPSRPSPAMPSSDPSARLTAA